MKVGASPVNKVGSNNRSNESVQSLYWAARNEPGRMITVSPLKEVAAVADVGDNISSVVFNICKGNNNPIVISDRIKVYSGRAVFAWTPPDAGVYHFFVDILKTKYSNRLEAGTSAAPSKIMNDRNRDAFVSSSKPKVSLY